MEPSRPTSLPPSIVALLGRVLALGGTKAADDEVLEAATDQLMEAVGFVPSEARHLERPIPLASALTAEQRAVAEALAGHPEVPRGRWPLYWTPWLCRRWLGLEPGGVLLDEVELEVEGNTVRWPLVHALRQLLIAGEDERARALVDALPLPARVEALVGLHLAEADLEALAFSESLAETTLALLREDVGAGDWARALADWVLAEHEEHDDGVAMLLFAALVATGAEIEPRHDALLRLSWGDFAELGRRCIAAIPSERRQAAMVAAIEAAPFPSHRIRIGLAYLPEFPYPSVARVVLAELDRADDPAGVLERLEELAAEHPGIAEMVAAVRGSMPPVPDLRVASVLRPVTLEALDDVRRRQLELADELYGGTEATAAEILARGDDDEDGEHIHPRFLELRTIVGTDGEPRYDAWLYMVDSGTIFAAGTEQVVAEVIQCGLETGDRILRLALPAVIGSLDRAKRRRSASAAKETRATEDEAKRTTEKGDAPAEKGSKRAAAKKATKQQAKKASAKKTATNKAPKKTARNKAPKKTAANKAPKKTKKTAANKAPKKTAAGKAPKKTKKTAAKKTPKAAAKKTPKKTAAKKAPKPTPAKKAAKKPSGRR